MEINTNQSLLKIKDGDYNHALLHLAWYREDKQRYLLFGLVELFPAEFPNLETSDEHNLRITAFGERHYIYVRSFASTADAARTWYSECRKGNIVIPNAAGQLPNVELQITSFQDEPLWPNLITTKSLPFHNWGTVRAHHLLQGTLLLEIRKILTRTDAIRWLSDRLFFEILEYPEWFGSVSLVLPNPVFREFHQTLGINPDGTETSDCNFITRLGRNLTSITLYLTEHRPTGLAGFHEIKPTKPYIQIPHTGRTEQVSIVITSSEYGILEWHEPLSFVRSIHTEIGLISAKKRVTVPAADGRPSETYEQSLSEQSQSVVVGESNKATPITTQFYIAKNERNQRSEANRLDQKWFHGDEQEANLFIKKLIGKAREKVTIVDPYFASIELFKFALATSRSEVTVRILTAAEDNLKNRDRIDSSKEAGEVLFSQIKALVHRGRFQVLVMTGKPQVHDRFLVIDEEVWLSGNSLHSIGERAGMVIKLPNPRVVIDELEKIMNGAYVKDLNTWVTQRKDNKKIKNMEFSAIRRIIRKLVSILKTKIS